MILNLKNSEIFNFLPLNIVHSKKDKKLSLNSDLVMNVFKIVWVAGIKGFRQDSIGSKELEVFHVGVDFKLFKVDKSRHFMSDLKRKFDPSRNERMCYRVGKRFIE